VLRLSRLLYSLEAWERTASIWSTASRRTLGYTNVFVGFVEFVPWHCLQSVLQETPRLATRLLTKLCLISGDDHTRPPSLIGYFGGSAEQLRGEFLWKLGNTRESVPLRIAILELITASLEWQQGLAEMLINVHPDAPSEESKKRPQREFDDEYWVTHSLKVVLAFVHNPKFLKTCVWVCQHYFQCRD
jgi:hypothetical protein